MTGLWKHQHFLVDEANERGAVCHWDAGCGVGKTRAALEVAKTQGVSPVLVITVKPAMRSVWEKEIRAYLGEGVGVLILDKGTAARKNAEMLKFVANSDKAVEQRFVVVNYETAKKLSINAAEFEMVIADESHKLAGHSSQQSIDLMKLCYDIPHKITMTGTSWEDKPLQVYGQMRWLRPLRYQTIDKLGRKYTRYKSEDFGTWTEFFEEYVVYRTQDDIKIPVAYKNLDKLAEKIAPHMVRVTQDVLDLPPLQLITRTFPLSKPHKKAYDELKKEMTVTIGDDLVLSGNTLVQILRLQQMTGGFYQPFDKRLPPQAMPKGTAKLDILRELVDEFGGQPFIVFTRFQEEVSIIRGAMHRDRVSTLELTGKKDEHRDWQDGKATGLICNISAGAAGIDLTRAAHAVYYSTGYSRTDVVQSLSRFHRPGQSKPSFAYFLLAKDTVDEEIYATLQTKGDVAADLKGKVYGNARERTTGRARGRGRVD